LAGTLQEIWTAETKKDALTAFDAFVQTWGVKYDKAAECLIKDRDELLAFYDFPAEHWKHLRTTNVVESSFATVRHRLYPSGEGWRLRNGTAIAAHHENVFRSAAEIMRGSTIVRIPVLPE
jgi:transposase-like protein